MNKEIVAAATVLQKNSLLSSLFMSSTMEVCGATETLYPEVVTTGWIIVLA